MNAQCRECRASFKLIWGEPDLCEACKRSMVMRHALAKRECPPPKNQLIAALPPKTLMNDLAVQQSKRSPFDPQVWGTEYRGTFDYPDARKPKALREKCPQCGKLLAVLQPVQLCFECKILQQPPAYKIAFDIGNNPRGLSVSTDGGASWKQP